MRHLPLWALLFFTTACQQQHIAPNTAKQEPYYAAWSRVQLNSLNDLSTERLRTRRYGSNIEVLTQIGNADEANTYNAHFSKDGTAPYDTYLSSYQSDGLRLYSRLDVPADPAPKEGYPVIIYVHGWMGIDAAPTMNFMYATESRAADIIDRYVDAGYAVLSPGLRGHGTVNGKAAEGLEFLEAWDNGSYLSPVFYAIDVLNLLDGIDSLRTRAWASRQFSRSALPINEDRLYIAGHSQGGDVVLTALAIAGEGSAVRKQFAGASISSGCFPHRFTQVETYAPMANSLQAFMAGDGNWTGSPIGYDGAVNPNFVFPYPSDWIETLDVQSSHWTWQADTWSTVTVADSVAIKTKEMYEAINKNIVEMDGATFSIRMEDSGKFSIVHDKIINQQMQAIGGFGYAHYISEPINLHFSDRDYYSFPEWNRDLSERINRAGGAASAYEYPGTNHSLKKSKYVWYSPIGTEDGIESMIERDINLFR